MVVAVQRSLVGPDLSAGETATLRADGNAVADPWPLTGRVQYRRRINGVIRRAIADFYDHGESHFADQEDTEVTWFGFDPSAVEYKAVRWLLALAVDQPVQQAVVIDADWVALRDASTPARATNWTSDQWLG